MRLHYSQMDFAASSLWESIPVLSNSPVLRSKTPILIVDQISLTRPRRIPLPTTLHAGDDQTLETIVVSLQHVGIAMFAGERFHNSTLE